MLKKLIKAIVTIWVIAMVIFIGGKAYYNSIVNNPLENVSNEEIRKVQTGDTLNSLIKRLDTDGKLKNSLLVRYYVKGHSQGIKIKAGTEFTIKQGMSAEEVLESIRNAKLSKDPNVVKVTIPEGLTIDEMAEIFEKEKIIPKEKFIESCRKYELPPYIKKSSKRKYSLEGYLYPNTYEFKKGSEGKIIIDTMLGIFEERLEKAQKVTGVTLTEDKIDEIVTMASIIEEEIKAPEERPIAASVFYNRLKINMRLESCATVEYALGEHKAVLSIKDTQIESPYNTYRNGSLPVGPICSPRQESIEAALAPATTKYLYFVSKYDKEGTHQFSENLEQHNAAINKYQTK